MTVAELIEQLQRYDPDWEVAIYVMDHDAYWQLYAGDIEVDYDVPTRKYSEDMPQCVLIKAENGRRRR